MFLKIKRETGSGDSCSPASPPRLPRDETSPARARSASNDFRGPFSNSLSRRAPLPSRGISIPVHREFTNERRLLSVALYLRSFLARIFPSGEDSSCIVDAVDKTAERHGHSGRIPGPVRGKFHDVRRRGRSRDVVPKASSGPCSLIDGELFFVHDLHGLPCASSADKTPKGFPRRIQPFYQGTFISP